MARIALAQFSLLLFGFAVLPYNACAFTIDIPDWFQFGAATAAYQVEGAWNVSGKTPSIWDEFTKNSSKIKDGSDAKDACKSYEYWQRDIKMLKYLGVNTYRFSMSWPRLLPNGYANYVNPTAVEYYNKIINALLEANIEPVVTIYHWDLPQKFQEQGGWMNALVADWLEDFARVLFDSFGDRVKTWVTVNEPTLFGNMGYGTDEIAPGLNAHGFAEYVTAKNALLAHARVYHMYNDHYRAKQQGQIGIVHALSGYVPKSDSESDESAVRDAELFNGALYLDPIFSKEGGFPQSVIDLVAKKSAEQGFCRSRLQQLSKSEIEYIKGTSDFLGLNYYFALTNYSHDPYYPGLHPVPSFKDDLSCGKDNMDAQTKGDDMPFGFRDTLLWIKNRYNNPKVIITENGLLSGVKNGVNDKEQLEFHKKYLYTLLKTVIFDDVNVVAYIVWSLMDVFEWNSGYEKKLGLFQTDFDDEKRKCTCRLACAWYRDIIKSRQINLDYVPQLDNVSF